MPNLEKKRVVTALNGGLANQMFQYAAGRSLALRLGCGLALDVESFSDGSNPRPYSLDIFGLPAEAAPVKEYRYWGYDFGDSFKQRVLRKLLSPPIPSVREPFFHYWDGFEAISGPVHLAGYWQSEKYFGPHKEQVRRDFVFPPFREARASVMAKEICSKPNAVSLHVRRGDYVGAQVYFDFHGVCSEEYYRRAVEFLRSKLGELCIYVFSDDLPWCMENLDTQGLPTIYVDLCGEEGAYRDMQLMALCKHHIIANSSFSWWGAWLGEERGITIAPLQWFGKAGHKDTYDVCPDQWVRF